MATKTIATATSVKGTVFVRDALGNERVLHQGDVINAESKIVVKAGGRASLTFTNGEVLVFGPGDHAVGVNAQSADADVSAAASGDVANMAENLLTADAAAERIAQAIRQGKDIEGLLEETAAGATGGGSSEGHNFVRLDRITEEIGNGSGSYGFSDSSADDDTAGGQTSEIMSLLGGQTPATDTTPPGRPTVTITSDADGNGWLSADELKDGKIEVLIELPADAQVGDIVTVTDGTTTHEIELTPELIAAGGVTVEFDAPGEGGTITVTATVTDPAGNSSPAGQDSAQVDTTATGAPTVTITEDTNNDGYINAAELDGLIDVEIGLPAGAQAGDTLTVTDGTTPQGIVLTAGQIAAGVVTTSVAVPAEGSTLTVTATLTDAAGNVSAEGQDSAVLDTTAPGTDPGDPTGQPQAPTVTITTDANNDGLLNGAELDNGKVEVRVDLPAHVAPGDTLTVTDGTTTHEIELTPELIAAGGVTVEFDAPGEGGTITVTATVTDPAGNSSPAGQDSAQVDTTATGAPTVTITEDTNNDGYINAAELDGLIDVEIGLPAGAQAGDTLTVTDGTTPQGIVLTAGQIAAGVVTASVAVPAEGSTLTVTATLTDAAGNVSAEGQDSAVLDTTAPGTDPGDPTGQPQAPTVTITTDANDDGLLNGAELDNGKVEVQIDLPAHVAPGDTLTVTDGTTTHEIELTPELIAAGGVTVEFDAPGEGGTITVTATVTDPAGNSSPAGQDSAQVDTTATGAPTVTITTDANNDGVLTGAELGSGQASVRIDLPAGAQAGDTLTVTDGTTTQEIELTPAQVAAGGLTVKFDAPGEGEEIAITATLTDLAGNASPAGEDSAVVRLMGSAPVIGDTGGLHSVLEQALASGSATVSGDLSISDPDGDAIASISASAPAGLTSGGAAVAWSGSFNAATGVYTLTGVANGAEVAKLTVDTDGHYDFKLSKPLDHPAAGTDTLPLTFAVAASDGTNTGYGDLTIKVVDDVPTADGGGSHFVVVPHGQGNVAPEAGLHSGHNILGLVGLTVFDRFIDLGTRQAFGAFDVNNNIKSVEISYQAVLGLGVHKLTASQVLADELGLKLEITNDPGFLGVLFPSSKIVITAKDGGPIDNMVINELLSTVYFKESLINLDVLNATQIKVTDTNGLSDTEIVGTLADAGLFNLTKPSGYVKEGSTGDDIMFGSDGGAQLYGHGGNDKLIGGKGNDILRGGSGNDTLEGGAGSDILVGGTGNDKLTGGAGSDIFRWENGDAGKPGKPAVDTITDFKAAAMTSGGDILDLRGLLQGEDNTNLANYLHFEKVGADTVIHISSKGGFAGGYAASKEDQTIVLKNVDLVSGYADDQHIGMALLKQGTLIVDTPPSSATGSLPGSFGADGGYVQSIGLGGNTYLYNEATNSVTQSGSSSQVTGYSYDAVNHWLTLTTKGGETIKVNMADGAYAYSANAPLAAGKQTELLYTFADRDGDTASSSIRFTSDGIANNVAPFASARNQHGLFGLIGVSLFDLIDFGNHQAFSAYDANNNIAKVEIEYQPVLSLGKRNLTASEELATNLGLKLEFRDEYGLVSLFPTSHLVITAVNGGPIDNLVINEILASVSFDNSSISLALLNATKITVTDTYGLSDTSYAGNLIDLGILGDSGNHARIQEGNDANNVLTATSTHGERLYGFDGDDTLNGGSGKDLLRGGDGNDTLNGGGGNDILIGGSGNDTLTGGLGADVFRWELGDGGRPGTPALDTVTDFNASKTGGDVLDLRSLLVGENHQMGIGNLDSYIDISVSGGNTTIRISSHGDYTNGHYAAGAEDQRITLNNVNLYTEFGVADGNNTALLKSLLDNGKLLVD